MNDHHVFEKNFFIKKGETEPIKEIHMRPGDSPTDDLIQPGEAVEGMFI